MIVPIILLLALPAGAMPTIWSGVEGAPQVRYRWSRPASNSCLIDLENQNSSSIKLDVIAIYATNRAAASSGPVTGKRNPNATIVRQQTSEYKFTANINRLDHSVTSFVGCFGIVRVRASIKSTSGDPMPVNPDNLILGADPASGQKPRQ